MANLLGNKELPLCLSRVLDEVGLSETVINTKQQMAMKIDKHGQISHHLIFGDRQKCSFGSQVEGTTTPGLNSDTDVLTCFTDVNVIQDINNWKLGEDNVLVLQGGDIPAGYCRLQVLQQYKPPPATVLLDDFLVRDKEGRVIVTHGILPFTGIDKPNFSRHGPALTISGVCGYVDIDIVKAFKCENISNQVKFRLEQLKGKHCWPTADMLKTAEKTGFFVVPVGHRLSETPELEWRVTPSFTEKCLVLSMNNTQIKCYVVLKMIKKDFIIPRLGESITSFHLKNTLFHCVENTEHEFWIETNILSCIHMCLERLLVFVEKKCCPNFLIPDENLFSGRISEDQYRPLKKLLEGLLQSEGRFVFEIKCDDVGAKLRRNVGLNSNSKITVDSIYVVRVEVESTGYVFLLTDSWLHDNIRKRSNFTHWIEDLLLKLSEIKITSRDTDIRNLSADSMQYLFSTYGCLLASRCIRKGLPVSDIARSSLKRGLGSDLMSGKLKYASVLYSAGELDEATAVLEKIACEYNHEIVQGFCGCYREQYLKPAFCKRVFSMGDDAHAQKRDMMARHVAFIPQEIECCPLPMRFEMFRGVRDDEEHRIPIIDNWMKNAVVDAVVYLHFLRYMTYRKSGNHQLRQLAFDTFRDCFIQERLYLIHRDTAINLLGQCIEMEGSVEFALMCYTRSLRHSRRNNAANWLLPLALYKYFSQQRLL